MNINECTKYLTNKLANVFKEKHPYKVVIEFYNGEIRWCDVQSQDVSFVQGRFLLSDLSTEIEYDQINIKADGNFCGVSMYIISDDYEDVLECMLKINNFTKQAINLYLNILSKEYSKIGDTINKAIGLK